MNYRIIISKKTVHEICIISFFLDKSIQNNKYLENYLLKKILVSVVYSIVFAEIPVSMEFSQNQFKVWHR